MRAFQTKNTKVTMAIEKAFPVIISRNTWQPAPSLPGRLNALFDDLRRDCPLREPTETLELIRAIWFSHKDEAASRRLAIAIEAISAGARDLARPILDGLVRDFPDWAEAWNKRAALAYMERRDGDSIADIVRTLELEPRHFGAILGFAQICFRHGRDREAKAAFEIARQLNPHIPGLQEIVDDLTALRKSLH